MITKAARTNMEIFQGVAGEGHTGWSLKDRLGAPQAPNRPTHSISFPLLWATYCRERLTKLKMSQGTPGPKQGTGEKRSLLQRSSHLPGGDSTAVG